VSGVNSSATAVAVGISSSFSHAYLPLSVLFVVVSINLLGRLQEARRLCCEIFGNLISKAR
jgi:hypothetical protein